MRKADRQMKYRFNAAIFVRGGRAFIEIPFNVREEAGGLTLYFERKNTAMWRSTNAILREASPRQGGQTRNFGAQPVRGEARPATAWGARRASGAGSRPHRPETRARGKCSVC